jgi:ABC-type branched-subunit amino acid transport system ATPase component
MSFLQVEGLSKSFGGLKAVHDVGFNLEQGEILGLIGPNGSGKTTTLNLLTGFLKPDSGIVMFKGQNMVGLPRAGYVERGGQNIPNHKTVPGIYNPEKCDGGSSIWSRTIQESKRSC